MSKFLQRRWLSVLTISAFCIFSLKVYLADTTAGAPDISVWKDFLTHIRECGVCVYKTGGLMLYPGGQRINPFNHPPFIIHFLRVLGFVSDLSGWRFEFVFRVITSLFDLGSAIIVYKILNRLDRFEPLTFLLYLAAPATIIISGYHGNTDTVMIFFVLLTAFLVEEQPAWLAGLAFGMGCNIKIIPIIFLVAFLAYLGDRKKQISFIAAAFVLSLLFSLPFIFQDPLTIAREVVGYASFPGRWGWTRALFFIIGPTRTFQIASRLGAYILLMYIYLISFRVNSRNRQPIFMQLGLIGFFFMSFTPSWGANYLAWLDPFPIALGIWPALLYYGTSGALLVYLYFINDNEGTSLMGLAWIGVLIVNLIYLRRIRKSPYRSS